MGNSGVGGESQLTAKNLLLFPTRKILLNKFTPSAIKSVIPSPSNTNFHLITLYTLHLQLQSLLLQSFLNVVFSMTKALNGQRCPKQNFYCPHLSMFFGASHLQLSIECLFCAFIILYIFSLSNVNITSKYSCRIYNSESYFNFSIFKCKIGKLTLAYLFRLFFLYLFIHNLVIKQL